MAIGSVDPAATTLVTDAKTLQRGWVAGVLPPECVAVCNGAEVALWNRETGIQCWGDFNVVRTSHHERTFRSETTPSRPSAGETSMWCAPLDGLSTFVLLSYTGIHPA